MNIGQEDWSKRIVKLIVDMKIEIEKESYQLSRNYENHKVMRSDELSIN